MCGTGEYLALAVSLEDLGEKTGNERAKLLGATLTEATVTDTPLALPSCRR